MKEFAPERTTLVVVGVESYAVGPTWDLSGPAADARRFADWFWSMGVPPSRTLAFVSPLPQNVAAWAGGPVQAHEATRANLRAALVNQSGHEAGGDLLIVVWGGHGMATPGSQVRRHLFTSDATSRDPVNVYLDDVLAHHRSSAARTYPNQLWMVDACQTLPSLEGWRRGLPTEDLGVRDQRLEVVQEVLIAASPGERAQNLSQEQTGMWSRELLALLRGSVTWPPDAADLAERLRTRFAELRVDGLAKQTPFHLYFSSTTGREGSLDLRPEAEPARPTPSQHGSYSDRDLVDLMVKVPGFLDPGFRNLLVDHLPTRIGPVVHRSSAARSEALSLIQTCRQYPEGFDELAEAFLALVGKGTPADEVAHVLRQVQPRSEPL